MSQLDQKVSDFLAQKRIAVAGVSRNSRGKAANAIYQKLKKSGYEVFALNPQTDRVEGDPCYPALKAVPADIEGVVIVTRPERAEEIVRECLELGIRRVWMHRSFGKGSVSAAAARLCQQKGIEVIAGGCPMMFCEPVDFGHRCIRWFLRTTGGLPK